MNENGFLINNFSRKSKHFSRNLAMLGAMILIVGVGIFASIKFFTQDANAMLAGFDPGNIIDDATMSNKNSMSESDIQNFLNDKFGGNYKGGSPNGYGVQAYPGYQYHVENGHFVPLAQEKFGNNGLPAAGGQSSAHVVWQAAQDYSINPQVLLVILQKEQGLISDNWPNYTQYASATGFGCPDTAACDPSYGGFIAQVRNAAAFFREVLNGGWTNYPVGQNYIQYNPNAACGGSVINVQNRATSALYRYTPYQPNASAMAAGWGTGDSCGAYGNRNFYNYFTSWFGSTQSDVFTPKPGPVNLASGTYLVASTANRALDVKNGGITNGTVTQSYPLTSANSQIWTITRLPNGYYTFKNPISDRCLDVFNGSVYNGSPIGIWDCVDDDINQQFAISPNSAGGYYIQTKASGKVIDIFGNSFNAGAQLTTWSINNGVNQAWNFYPTTPIDSGNYTLTNYMSKKALDATGGQINTNGAQLQLWNLTGGGSQTWRIRNNNNGTYSILNKSSQKTLDAKNGQINTNGSLIQLWDDHIGGGQVWNIAASSGGYTFINPWSRKVLDIYGGQINTNGAKIQLWGQNGYDSQTWELTEI